MANPSAFRHSTSRTYALSRDYPDDRIEEKLKALLRLPVGWNFGDGVPATREAVGGAIAIWQQYRPFGIVADVFPGEQGSVLLVFYCGESCLELTISPKGDVVDLSSQTGIGFEFNEQSRIESASECEIRTEIQNLMGQKACRLPAFSILGSMTQMFDVSGALAFKTQVTGAAYRWSIFNASKGNQERTAYVGI